MQELPFRLLTASGTPGRWLSTGLWADLEHAVAHCCAAGGGVSFGEWEIRCSLCPDSLRLGVVVIRLLRSRYVGPPQVVHDTMVPLCETPSVVREMITRCLLGLNDALSGNLSGGRSVV